MTDRLNIHKLKNDLKGALCVTPCLLIKSCVDDSYQGNIQYLEDNQCNVGLLRTHLQAQIDEDNEHALVMGVSPYDGFSSTDMRKLEEYIQEYVMMSGQAPEFKEILEYITEENKKKPDLYAEVMFALKSSGYAPVKVKSGSSKYKVISKYCVDLVDKAANNRLDPLIGREAEVERMIEILAHYKKKNPLLVGPAGCGKTQIVEGLASAIAQDKVPDALKGAKIFSTSIASLMAGTKFRGDVEEKVGQLLAELKRHEKETQLPTYLFIDEIHQIIGAGSNGGNNDGSNIANIIKPELASGELALIGATTSKEYKRTIQKDDALNRRFQTIRIEEPSDAETIEILRRGIAPVLTDFHGVKFTKSVIKRAVELSSKYITDKAQPDKSISLLDSIGARLRTTESRTNARVSDVEKLISAITGTPVSAFKQKSKAEEYIDIEKELSKTVFGQSEAVKQISGIYERSKAGLSDEGQPIGSVLCVGPTGTGKTATAMELARLTDSHFMKINMGEYTEQHSVAKLFGAPAGYVGHKDGGLLTNEIRQNPHTVLLLDEIEKAHPKVFESLLGIIDGAKMTSGEGDVVDFSNVFILMTSNVGAAQAAKRKPINLTGSESLVKQVKDSVSMKALESTFSPEFRNKLTAVINFNPLGVDEIRRVTDKFLDLAKAKLKERKGVEIEFTEAVYEYVNKNGFDSAFGARPIAKLVNTEIVDRLVKPLLRGEVSKGDHLVFDVDSLGEVAYTKKEDIAQELVNEQA